MDNPLSYSAYKKLMMCPKSYEYYYIDKDRPQQKSSALIIGTIVDEVVNGKLVGKDVDYNKLITEARKDRVEFFDHDLDFDLISKSDVEAYAKEVGWKGDDIKKALTDMMKDQATLSDKQYKVLEYATWESLTCKIKYMLESFDKWIFPQIKEVHEIQTHLDDGETHGYLDFVATMNDGRKVLFDLKTSKMPYDNDAVLKSPQLSLYAAMYGAEYAGYIVLVKTINKNKDKSCPKCDFKVTGGNRKKCPDCKVTLDYSINPTSYSQLLIDKVPEHNKTLTKEAMRDSIKLIDNGVFPRNLDTCYFVYGKPCPYVNKCWRKK